MTTEELRTDYGLYLKKIKSDIRDILDGKDQKRKDVLDKAMALSGLTKEELSDRSASGVSSMYRSIIGTALAKMQKYGDIRIDAGGMVSLIKSPLIIVKEAELAPYLMDRVKDNAITKDELISSAVNYFGLKETETTADEKAMERLASRLLGDLVKRGKLRYVGGRYTIGSDSIVIKRPGSVYEEFIAFLNSKGGEFFESYSAMLLESYYRFAGMKVSSCNVIGGSDDGGIDVMLCVSDWLGFSDKVLVQCKQKSNLNVTLKEVKEFVGAFYVEKGTRGIIMTTSRFHRDAATLINSVDNVIGIDGIKLYEIAKHCLCGINEENGVYSVDYSFFGLR